MPEYSYNYSSVSFIFPSFNSDYSSLSLAPLQTPSLKGKNKNLI